MGLGDRLSESRWAPNASQRYRSNASTYSTFPTTPHTSPASATSKPTAITTTSTTVTCLEELEKHDRLLRRLKWKAALLLLSYQHASSIPASDSEHTHIETMFKLDFFEFFVLLERALVHLLASLHIAVPRGTAPADHSRPIFGTQGRIAIYNHRYHANLLEVLDRPTNPVHPALGIGDVRMYLGVAKDCRNKWKAAGEPDAGGQPGEDLYTLSSLNMPKLVPCILEGLERAREIAWAVVQATPVHQSVIHVTQDGYMDMDTDDGAWEAVPDAMEWEGC